MAGWKGRERKPDRIRNWLAFLQSRRGNWAERRYIQKFAARIDQLANRDLPAAIHKRVVNLGEEIEMIASVKLLEDPLRPFAAPHGSCRTSGGLWVCRLRCALWGKRRVNFRSCERYELILLFPTSSPPLNSTSSGPSGLKCWLVCADELEKLRDLKDVFPDVANAVGIGAFDDGQISEHLRRPVILEAKI